MKIFAIPNRIGAERQRAHQSRARNRNAQGFPLGAGDPVSATFDSQGAFVSRLHRLHEIAAHEAAQEQLKLNQVLAPGE